MTSSTTENYTLRLIRPEDNPGIAQVIREVSAEHGLTADKGFAVADPILDSLYEVYSQPRAAYWVIEMDGEILGGGGVSGLAGGDGKPLNYRKCISPPACAAKVWRKNRPPGIGICRSGRLQPVLPETTADLQAAIKLYENSGLSSLMPRWVTPATATVKSGC